MEINNRISSRVALLEQYSPPMVCVYWLQEVVAITDGFSMLNNPIGGATSMTSFQYCIDGKSDVIVLNLCGFYICYRMKEICRLLKKEKMNQLR